MNQSIGGSRVLQERGSYGSETQIEEIGKKFMLSVESYIDVLRRMPFT